MEEVPAWVETGRRERPLLRPGEIAETVPGVIVTQHSGSGKANQFFLRGFNLDHGTDFATYLEGVPINMPSHGHGQGYTDLNFLMPELVERVDYRKGRGRHAVERTSERSSPGLELPLAIGGEETPGSGVAGWLLGRE